MQHRIPISATFNLFKYINIVPSFNYTERWYLRKVKQSYDPNPNSRDHVRKDTINGFNRVWDYNLSLQMNTKLYGMYKPLFMKSKEIQIRHVFTPTVSYTYTPDFGKKKYGYYDTYTYTDENGEVQTVEYSPYEGAVYSYPGKGMSQNISFSVDNNIEMKFRSDKDSTGYKKVSLIDQLGASLSYDVANKRWSDLSMNLRLKLTKSYTFNMNASFATYAYEFDENGNVVVGDRTEWSYGRFGRFQGYSGSFSYTLNNDTFKKLTGIRLMEGFGQTETTLTLATFPWMEPKPGSMGVPNPQYHIGLLRADGREAEDGEQGQIVIYTDKGKPLGLFKEYYRNPELTREAWHDGVYYTGDVAWRDEDGYYWFVGRADDVIKSSGYRIGPFEVESALMTHPAVVECAITGVPDEIRGQVVKATIVLAKDYKDRAGEELIKELQNHVKRVTAPYKYPRVIEFVDELPKTISGKIRRVEIRQKG